MTHTYTKETRERITEHGFKAEDLSLYKSQIKWRGNMRLHMLNEDADTILSETDWPLCSGNMHYLCCSTGLVFRKDTGKCVRYSSVSLDLASIEPCNMTRTEFKRWHSQAVVKSDQWRNFSVKPGPKPKSGRASESEDCDDERYA